MPAIVTCRDCSVKGSFYKGNANWIAVLCHHCGDGYELLRDVKALNQLANLLGGTWTVWICAGCGHLEVFRRVDTVDNIS